MDQDSFRKLLATQRSESSSLMANGSAVKSNKKAILDPSQPVFQPRRIRKKVKQSEYRDRASERRAGVNEYAEVESVLEDFQQRTADLEDRAAVEEQRGYLGGDKDHTILVKGLDLALLEQNKARAAASHVDDDSLEAAFHESQVDSTIQKKRTREDLVRELKAKRAAEGRGNGGPCQASLETDDALEKAKMIGKFKPIGTPDSHNDIEKIKKSKRKGNETTGEPSRKKRRRKVVNSSTEMIEENTGKSDRTIPPPQAPSKLGMSPVEDRLAQPSVFGVDGQATSPISEQGEVDIFADVGEYEGVDFGEEDDDGDDGVTVSSPGEEVIGPASSQLDGNIQPKDWFAMEKESTPQPGPSVARPPTPPPVPEPQEEPELVQPTMPTRLVPLASSALPSISDFLAMDAQADVQKRRNLKKEKKQGEKKGKVSTKVDRDYKKLNSYLTKNPAKNPGGGHAGT